MADIQSAAAEIRRGKKEEEERRKNKLEMWAHAQPDGRPAEHRWRPLFNAAKFGWRTLLDAVPAKTQNPLKFAEVPQTRQQIYSREWPEVHHIVKTCGGDIAA